MTPRPLRGTSLLRKKVRTRAINAWRERPLTVAHPTAISSDQYFGRGSYDPEASAEAQTRLREFSGATAISSNAYFGRAEEEEQESSLAEEGGLLGELGQNETVVQLERGIRDLAGRVMANPDVQNFGESLRTGALKVSSSAAV